MKIAVFGPDKRVGALAGSKIVDLGSAGLPTDLKSFIEAGSSALDEASRVSNAVVKGATTSVTTHDIGSVQLRAPHVAGARIACAGGNFADHSLAMARTGRDPLLAELDLSQAAAAIRERGVWGFWKVGPDAVDPDGFVIYPAYATRLDYEAELAIVLGRPIKDAQAADLHDAIWGVTLFGDWSIRDPENPGLLRFATSKNFDTSYSVGPFIVAGEDIDPGNVDIETYVNGERRQCFNTGDMIISFAEYLAHLSRDFTFRTGDMISGGTAAGTAADSSSYSAEGIADPERFLKVGDEVEMRSPAIGSLTACVVAKNGKS